MSAADVKKAYDDWQVVEKEFGERHPKTLNYFGYSRLAERAAAPRAGCLQGNIFLSARVCII